MIDVICAALGAVATVIAAYLTVRVKRSTKRSEARAARRAKESRLAMELMYATCSLSLTTAKKLSGMHTNGDVEEAMTAAVAAKENYVDFVRTEAANNFAKM